MKDIKNRQPIETRTVEIPAQSANRHIIPNDSPSSSHRLQGVARGRLIEERPPLSPHTPENPIQQGTERARELRESTREKLLYQQPSQPHELQSQPGDPIDTFRRRELSAGRPREDDFIPQLPEKPSDRREKFPDPETVKPFVPDLPDDPQKELDQKN